MKKKYSKLLVTALKAQVYNLTCEKELKQIRFKKPIQPLLQGPETTDISADAKTSAISVNPYKQ